MQDNQSPMTQSDEWILQVKELHLHIQSLNNEPLPPISEASSGSDDFLIPYRGLAGYVQQFHRSFWGRFFCFFNRIKLSPKQRSAKKLLSTSALFDEDWYLNRYPDVEIMRYSAVEHYIARGWREGRNPGPDFDTLFYLQSYPDVHQANVNPLEHYIRFGCNENRQPKLIKV